MAKRITIDFVSNGEQCCFYDCGVETLHFNIYKDINYMVAGNFSDLEEWIVLNYTFKQE